MAEQVTVVAGGQIAGQTHGDEINLKGLLNGGLPAALGANGGLKVEGVAGGVAQPVSVSHGTPGTTDYVESRPNCRRNAGVLHRDAIAAVDKITALATGNLTTADNGAGTGSLNQSTTFYVTAIAGNRWGPTSVAAAINTQATGGTANTHSVRLTIAQATGPNSSVAEWYDIFLSTDAAPKWVGRITEAQRAAGDYEITAVGTVAAGGGNPAGTVDINVVGTGIQTSNTIFVNNNAYVPNVASGITSVNCAGYSKAHVKVKLALTDLRTAPALTIVPFFANQVSTGDWHQGVAEVLSVLNDLGQSMERELILNVDGETGLRVLVGTGTGQNWNASIWVELC